MAKIVLLKELLLVLGVFSPQLPPDTSCTSLFLNTALSTTLLSAIFTAKNCGVRIYVLPPWWQPVSLHNRHQWRNKEICGAIWRERSFCYLPGFTGLKERFNLFYCNLKDCTCGMCLWRLVCTAELLYAHDGDVVAMLLLWTRWMKVQLKHLKTRWGYLASFLFTLTDLKNILLHILH